VSWIYKERRIHILAVTTSPTIHIIRVVTPYSCRNLVCVW
jgi:hypothetical protein